MLSEVLSIILYVLGSILLVVLIILGIKLIITMNKIEDVVDDINVVVDDINGKVKSLNGLFTMIDYTTDKLALFSDRFVDVVSVIIKKIFVRKEEKKNEEK